MEDQRLRFGSSAVHPGGVADAVRLAGYAFLILFFELALIRFVSAYVRVFGFYLNFVLIATFLGMGVGLMRAELADRVRWIAPVAAIALFGVVKYFSNVVVQTPADDDEAIWGVFFDIAPTVRQIGILPTVTTLFALCVLFFIPLGALLGQAFRRFKPLHAYSIDVGGSVLGILTFALLSVLRSPPIVWFIIGYAIWVLLSLRAVRFAAVLAAASGGVVALVTWTALSSGEYWSPYYRVNVEPSTNHYSINVNGSFHQFVVNFDPVVVDSDPMVQRIRSDYREPFRHFAVPDTVLVVGAGTGNDVTLLLELGVKYIDAVEIDPVILDLGSAIHFQQPYADPRVRTHVTDAREFLRNTDRTYDVIVFGTLDSQTLLSGMSSLRLDNYVYTVEAFRDARLRLKDGGSVITYHMSPTTYIAAKIYGIMEQAFEAPPAMAFRSPHYLFNYIFVAGGAADAARSAWGEPSGLPLAEVTLPRDNWPYLYLRRPTVPAHYLRALGAVLLVGLIGVGVGRGRRITRGFDWAMFFMGAGFLLLETKSVSEMSLLFGATWQVNLLVFSSILVMILIANLCVLRWRPEKLNVLFAGLFTSLTLVFLIPIRSLLWLSTAGQWIVGGLVVALPMLFAAMIFATLFQRRKQATEALAANVLGAVVGGVAEYLSMMVGIKGLYLLAGLMYAAVYLTVNSRKSSHLEAAVAPRESRSAMLVGASVGE